MTVGALTPVGLLARFSGRPRPTMPSMGYEANSEDTVLASPKVREKEGERKETVSVAVVPLTLPVP